MTLASRTARRIVSAIILVTSGVASALPVSVQLVNPSVTTAIRVQVDGKLVFDGVPERSPSPDHASIPVLLGSFELGDSNRHSLTVQTVASPVKKARLEWTGRAIHSKWIVIRYYPGQGTAEEPAFFTVALQESRAANK